MSFKNVTLKDVAREAGVSISAVSRGKEKSLGSYQETFLDNKMTYLFFKFYKIY